MPSSGKKYDIEIISAPSILGLQSNGVELLAEKFLENGLAEKIGASDHVAFVPTLNSLRNGTRDAATHCLNAKAIHDFSITLGRIVRKEIGHNHFPLVLGGDCSILIGILSALKSIGNYGLVFIDAHADFYEPEKSTTGEVADMDLAIVTGRGPDILTNIHNNKPYVADEQVIHIGQRDWEETKKFHSQDIRETSIYCISMAAIENDVIDVSVEKMLHKLNNIHVAGFWIHFDTDVLNDEINPAVDYRLPGGLSFEHAETIVKKLLGTGQMIGMSVSVYNANLDENGHIARNITESLARMFVKK